MMTPSWLADILAALMIATAVYCAARLVAAYPRRQRGERDVDATHVLLGVGMAGMLVSALDPVSAMVWEVVFGATTAWFAWRAARAWRHRATLGHGVVHLLANGAMLYMLMAGPAHGVVTGMGGMNGGASTARSSGGTAYPTIGLVLAVFLAGYAVLRRAQEAHVIPPTLNSLARSVPGGAESWRLLMSRSRRVGSRCARRYAPAPSPSGDRRVGTPASG